MTATLADARAHCAEAFSHALDHERTGQARYEQYLVFTVVRMTPEELADAVGAARLLVSAALAEQAHRAGLPAGVEGIRVGGRP